MVEEKYTDAEKEEAIRGILAEEFTLKNTNIANTLFKESLNSYKKADNLIGYYYELDHVKILSKLVDEYPDFIKGYQETYTELEKYDLVTAKGKLSLDTHLIFKNLEKNLREIQKVIGGNSKYGDLFNYVKDLGIIYQKLYECLEKQINVVGIKNDNLLARLCPTVSSVEKYLKKVKGK